MQKIEELRTKNNKLTQEVTALQEHKRVLTDELNKHQSEIAALTVKETKVSS